MSTKEERLAALNAIFGVWKDRDPPIDGLAYQEAMRAEWDERELAQYQGHPTPEHLKEVAVRINVERMQAALDSPSIAVPMGMTREEKLAFFKSHSEKDPKST
jgi:hypothetical protein